jgi:hypothetical protein
MKEPLFEWRQVIKIGQLRAAELVAPSKDKDGSDILIYQAMIFHGSNYTLSQATIPVRLREPVLRDVKALTRSFKLNEAADDEVDEPDEDAEAEDAADTKAP